MIEKIGFRDQVKDVLQEKLFKGELKLGQRISLPELARELNVSVTPVREALTQLTGAEILNYILNRGFFFPELQKEIAINIYPVISTLECFLLSKSSITPKMIAALEKCQNSFRKAKSPRAVVIGDMKFHEALLSESNNAVASQILRDLKTRIFLYETSYMNMKAVNTISASQHDLIIEALKANNLKRAVKLLSENWNDSFKYSLAYFDQLETKSII